MRVNVPEVRKCCFCFPLRYGIILFGIINIIFSLLAIASLVFTTELRRVSLTNGSSLEDVTSTVLFSILGLGVILNFVLLVGGCQKDISMLRLYNYYAVLTCLAALVPLFILLYRKQYTDVYAAFVAIVMQIYVIVLVRSETLKLEKELLISQEAQRAYEDEIITIPDNVTLL
ncbi:unnamed protein product [Diatraea saccharalis]|uniref:Uncharacterized protein n=1 Tax=Diatraea saccharalis TaxID=40085 RepID=A0A9N9QW57_9NEOP|nr:unnamed protein product [Diatraea saccharalis]